MYENSFRHFYSLLYQCISFQFINIKATYLILFCTKILFPSEDLFFDVCFTCSYYIIHSSWIIYKKIDLSYIRIEAYVLKYELYFIFRHIKFKGMAPLKPYFKKLLECRIKIYNNSRDIALSFRFYNKYLFD